MGVVAGPQPEPYAEAMSRDMPKLPKPGEEVKEAFRDLVPTEPGVALKPMFGNLASFVHGNMFAGLFGEELFVRLPDADQERLLAEGGTQFAPMPGRPMRGYITVPRWRSDGAAAGRWIQLALTATGALPPKEPKKRKSG